MLTEDESTVSLNLRIPDRRAGARRHCRGGTLRGQEIGYPAALKVVSHDITHKYAVGGVELGVCSPADLRGLTRA